MTHDAMRVFRSSTWESTGAFLSLGQLLHRHCLGEQDSAGTGDLASAGVGMLLGLSMVCTTGSVRRSETSDCDIAAIRDPVKQARQERIMKLALIIWRSAARAGIGRRRDGSDYGSIYRRSADT